MSERYVVRDTTTGEIMRTGSCPASLVSSQAGTGEVSEVNIDNVDDVTNYYDITSGEYKTKLNFTITQDKTQIADDGIDTVVFSNIPAGTLVIVRKSGEYVVNDGILSYKSDIPGKKEFIIINHKYETTTLDVEVV